MLLQHAASQQCLSKTSIILSFIRERKNLQYEGSGYLQKICHSCKKLTNYEHLATSNTKKQTQVASGLH